jgi:hypothetical protein
MNTAEPLTFQPGDIRGYDAIAAIVASNLSLLLKSFDELRNPATFRATVASECFAKTFVNQSDEFCSRCSSQAAKLMRECTVSSGIRAMPTVELTNEIRTVVFEDLDRPIAGLKGLLAELGNVTGILGAGVNDPAMRLRGMRLVRGSEALFAKSIGEYLEKLNDVNEQLVDFCCAKTFGEQISIEKQKAALKVAQSDMQLKVGAIIKLIHIVPEADPNLIVTEIEDEDEDENDDKPVPNKIESYQNDVTSPKFWKEFFTGFGVIVLILIVLGVVVIYLTKE